MFAPILPIHGTLTENDKELFWARVAKGAPDDCWLYGRSGDYGRFSTRGIGFSAHRVAWVITNGREIPEGFYICHSCDVRACVNPAHLWLGTLSDNQTDAWAKGRRPNGLNARELAEYYQRIPPSSRSKIARTAWDAARAEFERRALERRERWLQRCGLSSWDEWLASDGRKRGIEKRRATKEARWAREMEALKRRYPNTYGDDA